jgi:hypothetical protein
MKLMIKKNKAVFLLLFILNLSIAFLAPLILPQRYLDDTPLIVLDPYNEIGWVGSFPFAIMFYKITGLRYLPFFLVALVQIPIISYILYKIGVPDDFHKVNTKNLVIYIALFIAAVFISFPSKEFITFLMFSSVPLIYLSKKSNRFKIIASLILIPCFSFFREYYLLIPILAIGMYIATFIKFKRKVYSTVFYGLILAVFLSFSHGLVKGEFISKKTRQDHLDNITGYKVNSSIQSPIPQDTWYGEGIGIFYGFFAVNLPLIEGAKNLLSPQVIAFVVWQSFVFYILIVQLSRCLQNKKENQLKLWALLILFSYFIIQGIFEPDLGTSVRHKMGFLPIIYFVFYYDSIRKKKQNNI